MVLFDSSIFDGFVEDFDLSVCPWMFEFCKLVNNTIFFTNDIKWMMLVFGLKMLGKKSVIPIYYLLSNIK